MNLNPPDRRDTDIPIGDTARILAIIYTLGYFAMVLIVLWRGIPAENKDVVLQLIGILSIIQTGIVAFYFGGSKAAELSQRAGVVGRAQADAAIQEIAKAAPVIAAGAPAPIKAEEVKIDALQATVTEQPKGKS
jgi:hypothetical protein